MKKADNSIENSSEDLEKQNQNFQKKLLTSSSLKGHQNNSKEIFKNQKAASVVPPAKMYWAHFRGLESEKAVIQYYLKRNFKLLKQRVKTPFAEVDLLLRSPLGHLLMVEVKSANQACFYSARISKRQMQRLARAASFLAARFDCLVEYHWAFVDQNYSVTVVEDIC